MTGRKNGWMESFISSTMSFTICNIKGWIPWILPCASIGRHNVCIVRQGPPPNKGGVRWGIYLFIYLIFCCFKWVLQWRSYLPKGLPRRWCLKWKPKPFSLALQTPFKIMPLVSFLFLVTLMNCDLNVYSHILYKPLQNCDYRPKKSYKTSHVC